MKLHRTSGKPDWLSVAHAKRNMWQRLAAWSYGLLTPGNITTLIGFGLVIGGLGQLLYQQYVNGLILIAVGRLADVADGWLADRTATKSPLGELLDATLDKVGTFATLGVFAVAGIAPLWVLLMLFLPHALISLITMIAAQRKRQLHPSRAGKLSMATAWISLVAFVWTKLEPNIFPAFFTVFAIIVACVSVVLSVIAARGYMQDALHGFLHRIK